MTSSQNVSVYGFRQPAAQRKAEETKLRLQRTVIALLQRRAEQVTSGDVADFTRLSIATVKKYAPDINQLINQTVMPLYSQHHMMLMDYAYDHSPADSLRYYIESLIGAETLPILVAAYYHDKAFEATGPGLQSMMQDDLRLLLESFKPEFNFRQVSEFFSDAILTAIVLRRRQKKSFVDMMVAQIMYAVGPIA